MMDWFMDHTDTIVTNLLEGFRGWVSPSGQQLETDSGEDHGNHADRILDRAYPAWEWERSKRFTEQGVSYPTSALEYKGWIRVVDDGIYSVYKITPATVSSLEELINGIDDNTPVTIGVVKGRSLHRSTKEEALRWLGMVTEDVGEEDDDFKEVYGEPQPSMYLPLGTIIHGTMRVDDLIPAFLEVLERFEPETAASLKGDFEAATPDQREELCWERVVPILDRFAPPYTYFGSHPGNSSDYGVWVNTEALDEAVQEGDPSKIIVIKKGHPVPRGQSQNVVVVDDDGSYLSLWDGKTGAKLWDESSEPMAESARPVLEDDAPRIRGEYWITDGDVWFADGDVGDMNHEMYARDYACRRILDFLHADNDEEFLDEDTFREAVIDALKEDGIAADKTNWWTEVSNLIHKNAPDRLELVDILEAATGTGDARSVAVEHFGWIWVRGSNLSTWTFNKENILSGISEIIQQEDPEADWSNLDLEIFVASTKKRYSVTYGELESGRTPSHDPTWPVAEPPAPEPPSDQPLLPGLSEKLGEKVGTGIYMKQLDSGRRVYSCKCPVCGTIHGGYKTFEEASKNLKCREHHRKEIDKTKKEIEKVDEPKKQKNIFQNKLNKTKVIGEDAADFEDDATWKEVTDMGPDRIAYTVDDGREHFKLSRDGLIGRQSYTIGQMTGQWSIKGMTFHHWSKTLVPWHEIRRMLERGEKLVGFLWDNDHGTIRRWGKKVEVYKSAVSETQEDEDVRAILSGQSAGPGGVEIGRAHV